MENILPSIIDENYINANERERENNVRETILMQTYR